MKSLQEEEKLTIRVQRYPALYNKTEPSFQNKNEKLNAWAKIVHELQLGSWNEA